LIVMVLTRRACATVKAILVLVTFGAADVLASR